MAADLNLVEWHRHRAVAVRERIELMRRVEAEADYPTDHPVRAAWAKSMDTSERWAVCHEDTADRLERCQAEVEELRSKVALLTGAMLFDTGKRPVWSDQGRTLGWERVDPPAARRLMPGDVVRDNDPRESGRSAYVMEIDESHPKGPRALLRFPSGRETWVRVDRVHMDSKSRRSGWSVVNNNRKQGGN